MDLTATAPSFISRYILLTDIAGSSRLMEEYPQQYHALLDRHNQLVVSTCAGYGGEIFKNTGDGYYIFFETAHQCVAYAHELALRIAEFPALADDECLRVRIVAHAGEIRPAMDDFFGPALNRASRMCAVCHPGQILISDVAKPATDALPPDTLLTDLGLHHLRDLGRPERLYQLNSSALPQTEFPALDTLNNRPNNLFQQPNAFIGRAAELAELTGLLEEHRLVSIVAPGGYGKSRLAAHLCAELVTAFSRGVFFIELAPVRDPSGIISALANAIGFQFHGRRSSEQQIVDFLRDKDLLLCFDNFEHVLGGAGLLGKILKDAPLVKAVATSREPLHLTGEQLYRLAPLPVTSEISDAVRLFADRAALANSGFTLNADNCSDVAAVCQRLDGIPLAIELAAAWLDSFTLPELLTELDGQLELTARMADLPARHRSLRACLDWSWNLLEADNRRMLMVLSTFHGGCFPDAAAAVLGKEGMQLRSALARLVDKSWLYTRAIAGQTRFYLRDAVSREFAFEKLRETQRDGTGNICEQAVLAHANYYSAFMEREGIRLQGPYQLAAVQSIRLEKQNIYAAQDELLKRVAGADSAPELAGLLLPIARWLQEYLDMISANRELADRYDLLKATVGQSAALRPVAFWALLGCSQGHRRLGDFDDARENARTAWAVARELGDRSACAHALNRNGTVEYGQGDYVAAQALYQEALDIWRRLGDKHGISLSLNNLGAAEYVRGQADTARGHYNESLALKRELGDRAGTALTLLNLGMMEYERGEYTVARSLYDESLAIRRQLGDRNGIATALNALGILERNLGNHQAALNVYDEALTSFREIGNLSGIAMCLNNLGSVERNQGNAVAARTIYRESLAIFDEIGDRNGISLSLNALGIIECSQRNYEAARRLFDESLASDREIGNQRGIALALGNCGTVEFFQANYSAAARLYADSLTIRCEFSHQSGICESTASIGCLLVTTGYLAAGAICLYGTRRHVARLRLQFDPQEHDLLEQGLAGVEHPVGGLTPDELEQATAQAEAMTLAELAAYALAALESQ